MRNRIAIPPEILVLSRLSYCPKKTLNQSITAVSFIMKHTIYFLFGLLLLPVCTQAQVHERIFQVSGMVISRSNSSPIPFVTAQVNHSKQGTLTNLEGFYSIPVSEFDTIYFSHIGFKRSRLVMKEYLKDYKGDKSQYIYVVNYLTEDSVTLPTVNIFPYDTPEELRTAFLNMENTQTQMERNARENLDPRVLHEIMQNLEVDGGERLAVGNQIYYNQFANRNVLPTVGFNPMAAVAMLQYIVQKAEKRRNKNLNYWE